jgi:hypothetical protein
MTDKAVALVERGPGGERAMSPFADEQSFEPAQRMAKALATSTLVPKDYQNNIPNVLIAMELANRTGASVLMVMQNLYLVHGRPGWASSFLIATVNSTGRFTPLRFRFQGEEGKDGWGCRAVAVDKKSGEECVGSLITIGMAKKEGWYQKSGSKWQTMPEQMLMYRSASFWTRAFAPEVALGIHTAEEVVEMYGGDNRQSAAVADLNAALADEVVEAEIVEETDGDLFGPEAVEG